MEPTYSLIARAQRGDEKATNDLVRRYTAVLRRWGHGRLPRSARARSETQDLVQVTLVKTLGRLGAFEPRRDGAFTS